MTTTFQIVDGDVVISAATGQPKLVSGSDKLKQDIREMLSTSARADGIGAGLEEVVDGRPADPASVRGDIARRIRRAISVMQSLQTRRHLAERPDEELVGSLALLRVLRMEDSQTAFAFRAEIKSVRGDVIGNAGVVT